MKLIEVTVIFPLLVHLARACDVKERQLLNKTKASLVYLIHSIDPVSNGELQLKALFKILGFKEHKLPFILDSNLFKLSVTHTVKHSLECLDHSVALVSLTKLLPPINVTGAIVIYGCDLHYRRSTKIAIVNDVTMNNSTISEFHAQLSLIDMRLRSSICWCNETLNEYARKCIKGPTDELTIESKTIAVFVIFFLIISSVATVVLKSGWRNQNVVGISN